MEREGTETLSGMSIEWDVPIEMSDGCILRADVFRPTDSVDSPVIVSHGPYGKWLHIEDAFEERWHRLTANHPDVTVGTSNRFQNWETVDPERWVPDGYAVVRVDSRGAGRSPGFLDPWSRQETEDFAECIRWAGEQPWSNGKVGLAGISYFAMNQWQVAALQPEHLAAICPWEGAADFYRDVTHHGGIQSTFLERWYRNQVVAVQHGVGERGPRSRMTGGYVAGPETLTEEELGANRADFVETMRANELATADCWTARTPDWSSVEVPILSAANWGGHGLHPRGNFEGFLNAASAEKWLEVHGAAHWTHFYTTYGVTLQKQFFGHFLKGEDTGWTDRQRVLLNVRHPGAEFTWREEADWPLPRTDWTRYYLDSSAESLTTTGPSEAAQSTYDAFGPGVTFLSAPLTEPMEVTGPIASTLYLSSDTPDADVFLVVRVFGPDMAETVFQGSNDPTTPIALGWLRASHRKLDPDRTTQWRPYHTHDEIEPLTPGEVYELDVEVWPTSIVVPAGSRLGVSVRGTDYEYPSEIEYHPDRFEGRWNWSGVGPFKHDDPDDRDADTYGGEVTVHTGPEHPSHVLLPRIPKTG